MPVKKTSCPKYVVVRDTREKEGQGWSFASSKNCDGMVDRKLDTGDYTIQGFEETLTIDRKGSVAEFAGNLYQDRFLRELDRMASYKVAIVLLEFSMDDVMAWPASSGLPEARWGELKLTNYAFLKRVTELQMQYPHVRFIFAGRYGKEYAASVFKRFVELGDVQRVGVGGT